MRKIQRGVIDAPIAPELEPASICSSSRRHDFD